MYTAGNVDMELEVIDELTWTIRFVQPNPLLPIQMAKTTGGLVSGPSMAAPKHYLSRYIPHLTDDPSLIDAALAANGLTSWEQLHYETAPGDGRGPINFWYRNPELPTITPWISENSPVTDDPYLMVRNPYYHCVDIEGNQLPYIDRISHALFQDQQTLNLWIAQGLIDMQQRHLSSADYTFFRENQEAGDYHVVTWRAAQTNAFHPNICCADPVLRQLFDTPEFREALSIAINREEINQLIYSGIMTPRQASPVRGSPQYDPEFTSRWTEYDPERANALLDGLGLTERDSAGHRLRPDGQVLGFTITYSEVLGSMNPDEVQLVVWDLWDQVQREPDEATRHELFMQILAFHKEHPYMIGTVGEDPQSVVVKNNFMNVGSGFISDDTLRNEGIARPKQFFIRQA